LAATPVDKIRKSFEFDRVNKLKPSKSIIKISEKENNNPKNMP